MRQRAWAKKLQRLEALIQKRTNRAEATLQLVRDQPGQIMTLAGMTPDPWQEKLLQATVPRMLLLCSRQSGKSTVAAVLALRLAFERPRAPILVLSPSMRQSAELFRKVLDLFNALGRPLGVVAESASRLELANGSRIVSLPGDEETIRGFSGVAMLIIDEAARVPDDSKHIAEYSPFFGQGGNGPAQGYAV